MIINKRAQHETFGFALIIIIVMVIGVIFLGISLRQKTTIDATDAEISNFLVASCGVTTECYLRSEPDYRTLGELVKDCEQPNADVICPASTPCKTLNKTYSEILKRFRPAGITLSYYSLSFMFNATGSEELTRVTDDLVFGTTAGCKTKRAGENPIFIDSGEIIETLTVCAQD